MAAAGEIAMDAAPRPAAAAQEPGGLSARLEAGVVRAIGMLPPQLKRLIAGAPLIRDGLELDLDTQALLRLERLNPRPPLSSRTPREARADLRRSERAVRGRPIALAEVRETRVAGAAGELRARLYVPARAGADPQPLLVYFHGGGWVAGDLDTHEQPCRALARAAGARVLSVEYRLAPEHPFPAAVEDALSAFRDAAARAGELGCDPARVAVGGDSAGGHLAAVTAQLCAAQGGPQPALQLLLYPVTDLAATAPSRLTFAEGFVLTKENMDWYERQFIGPAGDRHDPRVSPLRAPELGGVAPALVVTAGFDPLRDEGEAYARRLGDAGVPVLLRRYPGYVHGFIHAAGAGSGPREALAEIGGMLRAEFAWPDLRNRGVGDGGLGNRPNAAAVEADAADTTR